MFDLEKFRAYCLQKKGVSEEFPFGPETLVYKVMGKIFAITGLDNEGFQFNIKCDPEIINDVRAKYPAVQPGYHMNKQHWNTVHVDGSIATKELLKMIDDSYELVIQALPKKSREELKKMR